jgi:hypothetical protein
MNCLKPCEHQNAIWLWKSNNDQKVVQIWSLDQWRKSNYCHSKNQNHFKMTTKNNLNDNQFFFKWWSIFFNCWINGGNQFTSIRQLKLYGWWLKNFKHRLKILFKRWPIFFKCSTYDQMIKKIWLPKVVQKHSHRQNKMSMFDLKNEIDTFGWTSIDNQCKMGTYCHF